MDYHERLSAESILVYHRDDRCYEASGYDCAAGINHQSGSKILQVPAVVSPSLSHHPIAEAGRDGESHGLAYDGQDECFMKSMLSIRGRVHSSDIMTRLPNDS